MPYVFREAVSSDIALLLEFEKDLIETERPFDPTFKSGQIHYYDLPKMIASEKCHFLVIEDRGEVIGTGYVRLEESSVFRLFDTHGYIGFMYVMPEHRGKGLSKQLLFQLVNWAKLQGVGELQLEVYANNAPAVRAYERFGFKTRLQKMHLPLDLSE